MTGVEEHLEDKALAMGKWIQAGPRLLTSTFKQLVQPDSLVTCMLCDLRHITVSSALKVMMGSTSRVQVK